MNVRLHRLFRAALCGTQRAYRCLVRTVLHQGSQHTLLKQVEVARVSLWIAIQAADQYGPPSAQDVGRDHYHLPHGLMLRLHSCSGERFQDICLNACRHYHSRRSQIALHRCSTLFHLPTSS